MPLGILSGDVPCSQAQRTHARNAIGWRSVQPVWELFDTPTYIYINFMRNQNLHSVNPLPYKNLVTKFQNMNMEDTFVKQVCHFTSQTVQTATLPHLSTNILHTLSDNTKGHAG